MKNLTADEVIKQLNLIPLQVEGGYYSQTWRTEAGTAIYYLVTPDSFSSLHKLDIPEIWHFYAGDPVKQLQLHPDGAVRMVELGFDLSNSIEPQLLCPAYCWQATKLIENGNWALMGTTMSPPYTDKCIVYPDIEMLYNTYDDGRELIKDFL